MATVIPFRGVRPEARYVKEVSCLPYDVMDRDEARLMGKSEKSFLHVVRSDIDLPDSVDIHDTKVYEKARENFDMFLEKGYMIQDEKESYYIYRQIMNGRIQTGICGCCSTFEYDSGLIKKHEFTRPEKEVDRINNLIYCSAHTEPVFFAHRHSDELSEFIKQYTRANRPVYDFVSDDGIAHILWVVDDEKDVERIRYYYEDIDALYIADGHHRTASACSVSRMKQKDNVDGSVDDQYNYIMAVIFDSDELSIMDYNRVVKNLNGLEVEEFLERVKENFIIDFKSRDIIKPGSKHQFGMYVDGYWYYLRVKPESYDKDDPVKSLDADILQHNLLAPVLGIEDPRTDSNIEFVGGIRGMKELQDRADKYGGVAFAVYPVTMSNLFKVADAGMVMPPKSTWFEPKLRSGLFVHRF